MSQKIRWYIAQANFGLESLAIDNLKKRIKEHGHEEWFGQIKTPIDTNVANKDLFPGYVLVQMIMNDESWHLVKDTPKIVTFLGSNRSRPLPISTTEAEKILGCSLSEFEKPELAPGMDIEIIDGPFRGYGGILTGLDVEKGLAELTIDMKGRTTPISMEIKNIRKLE